MRQQMRVVEIKRESTILAGRVTAAASGSRVAVKGRINLRNRDLSVGKSLFSCQNGAWRL